MKKAEKPEELQLDEDLKVFDTSDLQVIPESDLGVFSDEELKAMIWTQ
ncbi:hypothetical protein G6719_06670 [Polynucleobacter paneuropaeus]|nr:hypothetical protein G6719_06670 [Polynucleobacter paneuropaeus]